MVVVVLWEFQQVSNFILPDQQLGVVKVPFRFPCAFHGGVPFPSDEEDPMTGFSFVSNDHFDFILFFTVYKVWWQSEVIGAMLCCFLIG